MTDSFNQAVARIAVGAYEDAQEQRKAMMNRIRDVVRKRNEGIAFDEVEGEKEDDDFESKYQDDNLPDLIVEMREEGKLTDEEYEYIDEMLQTAQAAARVENRYTDIMRVTEAEPIYGEWLQHVYGVSTTLTAKLIHHFGYCEEREKVTQLWSYAGLAPGQQRRRGEQLNYSPQAKTLAWLVGDRIIMQGTRSRYKQEFYDPYKAEQVRRMEESMCHYCGEPTFEHRLDDGDRLCPDVDRVVTLDDFDIAGTDVPAEATPAWSQGHCDNRARRYLSKKFLKHYWYIAREIKGLSTPDEYVLVHGGDDGEGHEKVEDSFEYPPHAQREIGGGQAAYGGADD